MVINLNHKRWFLSPLLSAGFVLTLLLCTGHSALLKDIRVGEYSDHTRIVFELDTPAEAVEVELQSAGRLAVVFADTAADLIRKIPVNRSPRVKSIQIWERDHRLTALLDLDLNGFDHKSFSLTDPQRFVLDILPKGNAPDAGDGSDPAATSGSNSDFLQETPSKGSLPAPQPDGEDISETTKSHDPELFPGEDNEPPSPGGDHHSSAMPPATGSGSGPILQQDGDAISRKSAPQNQESGPDNPQNPPLTTEEDQSTVTTPSSTTPPSDAGPGRLQYYLVVVLVIITIVILMLLFLMLLVRHRWIEDKSRPSPTENPEGPGKT